MSRNRGIPSNTPDPRAEGYFNCVICLEPRPTHTESVVEGVCVYCQHMSQNSSTQLKWCIFGKHEVPRQGFVRPATGVESHEMCNPCFFTALDQEDHDTEDGNIPSSYASSLNTSSLNSSRRGSAASERGMNMTLSPRIRQQSRDSSPAPSRSLDATDPIIHYNRDLNNEDDPALSPYDMKLMRDFQQHLHNESHMEFCTRCKEQWFNTHVQHSVCKKCRTTRDRNKKDDEPFLMSDDNFMDPGNVPAHLPKLTPVEDLLISRVQVFMEIHQVRGIQFKYTGHVCNFLKNIGKIYSKLPLLPRELEIIILKPANHSENPGMTRQFKNEYKVRKRAIEVWLEYLKQNHPGYADVEIDRVALSQLPENGSVEDQLTVQQMAAVDEGATFNAEDFEDDAAEFAAIPDLLAEQTEIERMRQDAGNVQRGPVHLTQPDIRSTPLNEFNSSQALLSLAFPTLFPQGKAEFVTSRLRKVDYASYIERLLKYQDGRFAKHPRFRYVVFNTLMRHQVNRKAMYFAHKLPGSGDLDLEALKAAFVNPDNADAQRLLNSIVRYSALLVLEPTGEESGLIWRPMCIPFQLQHHFLPFRLPISIGTLSTAAMALQHTRSGGMVRQPREVDSAEKP